MFEITEEEILLMSKMKFMEKYKELEIIGTGAFGSVTKAEIKATHEQVAIKRINKSEMALKEVPFEQLKKEIQILNKIDDPNIVKFHDFFETSNEIYIVMEYIKDGNLENYINTHKNKISERDCKEIMHSLLGAIEHLHKLNIVHKDIKPENIMFADINNLSSLKLIDFGLSEEIDVDSYDNYLNFSGTVKYMAPEMINHSNCDNLIDLWSAGFIMFRLLNFLNDNQHPIYEEGDNINSYVKKLNLFNCDMNYLNSLDKEHRISKGAKELLCNLLNKNYLLRYNASLALADKWFEELEEKEENDEKEKMNFNINNISVIDKKINDKDKDISYLSTSDNKSINNNNTPDLNNKNLVINTNKISVFNFNHNNNISSIKFLKRSLHKNNNINSSRLPLSILSIPNENSNKQLANPTALNEQTKTNKVRCLSSKTSKNNLNKNIKLKIASKLDKLKFLRDEEEKKIENLMKSKLSNEFLTMRKEKFESINYDISNPNQFTTGKTKTKKIFLLNNNTNRPKKYRIKSENLIMSSDENTFRKNINDAKYNNNSILINDLSKLKNEYKKNNNTANNNNNLPIINNKNNNNINYYYKKLRNNLNKK